LFSARLQNWTNASVLTHFMGARDGRMANAAAPQIR